MKLFFSLFLFSSSMVFAQKCEIISYDKIYKINMVLDSSIIRSTNCPESIKQNFITLVQNADGKVSNLFIQRYIGNQNTSVTISPKTIQIKNMSELLTEKLNISPLFIHKISSLHGKSALSLRSNEDIEAECSSCRNIGRKNIKIKMPSSNIWLSAELGKHVSVLKPISPLNRLNPILKGSDFLSSRIAITKQTNHFTDIKNIRFYRLNRNIDSNSILKNNDVTPKSLVTFGQKVHLRVKTKNIDLKYVGIAKKGGRLGDFIEVQNQKTKKIFLGKIVDFNKVVVEI